MNEKKKARRERENKDIRNAKNERDQFDNPFDIRAGSKDSIEIRINVAEERREQKAKKAPALRFEAKA